MSEFSDLRQRLTGTRSERDASVSRLATAREQLRSVQQRIAALRRVADPRNDQALAELERQAATLESQVAGLRKEAAGLRSGADALLVQIAALDDPAEQIQELDDTIPILLFPVRLETRFHRPAAGIPTPSAAATGPQLWIRIYPDDCQVDSFEELLTYSEVANAREFWASLWRAGGIEAQERGAWQPLVAASGSGRAAYIIRQYAAPLADKPSKIDPQDVILVIVPQMDVTPAEQAAAFDYHIAVWKADGDTAKENVARSALEAAVGPARAADIRSKFVPEAKGQDPPKPFTRAQVRVSCAVLKLPPSPVTKTTAWTQAPRSAALPDRFVAMLFNGGTLVKRIVGGPVTDGLAVGPDPSLPPDQQIKRDGDDLVLNDDLLWLADFDRAVAAGMGIRVDLSDAEAAAGFDRLVVLGVRFSSDEHDGKTRLETLIAHHSTSARGFSLVPQGSPTNNTESDGSAYTWVDNSDASFDVVFKGKDAYTETDDPLERRDGQWLAEALGIDGAVLKLVPNAGGRDQGEARAANAALWAATLGYMIEEMMPPLFARGDIAATRQFFTRYVSGRGPLPAIRAGQQPYGILPAMAYSRYRAGGDIILLSFSNADYLQRLHTLLMRLDADWRRMSADVARVGQPGDLHQTLLNVLGLHSGSVEYYQRYAESLQQVYNKLVLDVGPFVAALLALALKQRSRDLLTQLGADPNAQPPILEKFFYGASVLLNGPVVDDVPLSENKPVRAYTPDNKNYIEWLATSPLDMIRRQDFGGNNAPTALLYLFLRHAMMLGQWDAGIRMLENRALVDSTVERREPAFLHVEAAASAGHSKFQYLYSAQPQITGDNTTTLGEYVLQPAVLASADETVDLREILAALEFLKDAPTARLERLFAEHIDCCTYRLDAWKTGLAAARLEEMREKRLDGETPGIYLGAFAWLEDLRPAPDVLSPVELEADLAAVFQRPEDAPLQHDPSNAGYIHAPSLNHAAAAAILKNAYRVNASPANPDAMAVNLSSERVRRAMSILEGVRNGQTLPALLGYRFERGLHDKHSLAEVDKFIYPLRQVFPLAANRLKSTKDETADVTLIEARNVVDGVKLLEQIRSSGQRSYPFGVPLGNAPGQLPPASPAEITALDAEAEALANLYDAIADLVMAESVYQVALGNFDRAAAVTTAFSQGSRPPEIEVVSTPRTGLSLTHRMALHLDPSASPAVSPSGVAMTPRAVAEAPLNLWLAERLPAPDDVVVRVSYSTPAMSAANTVTLSQADLGLQSIDLLYLANFDLDAAQSELDDRIVQAVRYGADAHPGMDVTIQYTEAVAGKITLMEMSALLRSLRPLLLKSRAIGPTDMAMPLETEREEELWDDTELADRVNQAITALAGRRDALLALATDASDLDDYARKVSAALLQTAFSGMPQTGTGQIHADIRDIYEAIAAKLRDFATRWDGKSSEYSALLATLPGLATNEERLALLQKAEGLISSTTTAPLPSDPDAYRISIDGKKSQFDARLTGIRNLLGFAGNKLVDFGAAAGALTPALAEHDPVPFDISAQLDAIATLRATLAARVKSLSDDLTKRIDAALSDLAAVSGIALSRARVQRLQGAAERVLGDEAQIIARFRLSSDRGVEFGNSVSAAASLLTDLHAAGRRFPVDDWLYGLARVRDKLNAWENMAILSEGFGAPAASLTPVQLPFVSGDRWLALEFDPQNTGPNRLLYTAHFAIPFDREADQCGLLLDEWPELVPGTEATSGVTFHFDRPSSQPPQAMLLAVPPALTGRWSWDDLVATINETLDAAKSRGVEPAQVDSSAYAQFLPATVMAVTLYQIQIATNLAVNTGIFERIGS